MRVGKRILAEAVRFELTEGLTLRRFSRPVHSTTLPSFLLMRETHLWCTRPESNRHGRNAREILSLLCLPISPRVRELEKREYSTTELQPSIYVLQNRTKSRIHSLHRDKETTRRLMDYQNGRKWSDRPSLPRPDSAPSGLPCFRRFHPA